MNFNFLKNLNLKKKSLKVIKIMFNFKIYKRFQWMKKSYVEAYVHKNLFLTNVEIII